MTVRQTTKAAAAAKNVLLLHPGSGEIFEAFDPPAARAYLDTASYGLPPRATVKAVEGCLEAWRSGTADWIRDWDPAGEHCRAFAAEILGAPIEEIALLPAVSTGVATIAAALGPEDEVVIPDDEFNSLLLPFLVVERKIGVCVRRVPFQQLADAIGPSTSIVATSHVRSNGGAVQDLDAVQEVAHEHGAIIVVDATHSAGVLPLDAERRRLDVVVCAAYKHLLCPRGVAFMRVARRLWETLQPVNASWRSTDAHYATYYGGVLDDLAAGAGRFDISLAWHAWVGARESLRFLTLVPCEERAAWSVGLASQLAALLDLPPTGSSVLGVPVWTKPERTREILSRAGVIAALPLGQVRASFHLYNRPEEVDYAAAVLSSMVAR